MQRADRNSTRYAFAALSVILAFLLRLALSPVFKAEVPLIFFILSIVFSGLYGGMGPGLFATVLGTLTGWLFFIRPYNPAGLQDRWALVRVGLFLLVSSFVSVLTGSVYSARRRAEESENRERAQREQLRVTLSSIGDAVIATDAQGRVTFLNGPAEALTGWSRKDGEGRSLDEVFNIVNENTRGKVESPPARVFREGVVVGLADHTVLIARDGTEHPIGVSGAPIRDEAGGIIGAVLVFRDLTERNRAEEALRESEERFAKAFSASPLVLTISSLATGKLVEVNETFVRTTGFSREEALGRTTLELGLWQKPQDREAELEAVRQLGQVRNVEYEFRAKDGTELTGLLSAERVEIGGESFALTVIQDITERKRAERERELLLEREQEARAQAEEASRLKDDFLATVSHELRTPLNSILGWARMLRGGRLDSEAAARAIETIERSARSQAMIIEDILDVSRIITGRLRLEFQTVALQPVIEAAVDSVRPAAEARGVLIEERLDAAVSQVSGDPQRIQQVIWNLLSNAIKFTPREGTVEVALERIDSHVEIRVSDTGVGIRPEFLPFVFDRFRQADGSTTRKHGGLGLGLAIVRHLVELHGGSVSAESAGEGQGATFRVRLPLTAIRGETEGAGRLPPVALIKGALGLSTDLRGMRVLVVDDEADARDLLSVVLAQSGAEVKAAASAAEALSAIEQWRPHVLVSDIAMPVEDGYVLIRRLRALDPERGGNLPAVALTAYARSEDRLRAITAGYQMHVAKPVDPEELAAVIASLSGRMKAGKL